MSDPVSKETFELVARQLGTHVSFVEKDWHVTKALKIISEIKSSKFQLVFSGGTALSKAHILIQRFSEDIDFIITTKDGLHSRKSRSDLKNSIVKSLKKAGFVIEKENVQARNENRFFIIDLNYTTYFNRFESLRPHIQIEMSIKEAQLPPVFLPVSSFVSKLSRSKPEVESIRCMSVIENTANKLSALTWRILDRVRGAHDDDPSIIRHIYDLAILKDYVIKEPKFMKLAINCIKEDSNRFKNKPEFVKLSVKEKFTKLLYYLESDPEYSGEYDQFVRGVCYSPENQIPNFKTAVKAIRFLIKGISNVSD